MDYSMDGIGLLLLAAGFGANGVLLICLTVGAAVLVNKVRELERRIRILEER